MSENGYKPRNYRIVRHVTKNRILDIQDALEIDKLRIEIVEGEGAKLSVEHFAEPDALALIFHDVLEGRPWEKYIEYKGVAQRDAAISRVLVVERVEARNPVKITVSRGPGKVIDKGAIQPVGKPEATLSVLLSEFDARRIAFTVLRHMAAYEAATYHARVSAGTRRPQAEAAATAEQPEEPEWPVAPASERAVQPELATDEEEWPVEAQVPTTDARLQSVQSSARGPAASASAARRAAPAGSYWAAAERMGLSRAEAEQILREAGGDWGQAWGALRRRRDQEHQRS